MKKESDFIYFTEPKIDKDTITLYGAGKFHEERLVLDKRQAMLAYVSLNIFLFDDKK
jgi:hypothetical protein